MDFILAIAAASLVAIFIVLLARRKPARPRDGYRSIAHYAIEDGIPERKTEFYLRAAREPVSTDTNDRTLDLP